jgi:Ca2+-binding RTX toxin-like protein
VRADGSAQANDLFSTDPDFGGRDLITGNGGNDTIVGGSGNSDSTGLGGDTLSGGSDNDVVIGDNATITRNNANVIEKIETSFPDKGGDDTVVGDSGNDILIGGFGGDLIDGSLGNDTMLGDNALLDYTLDGNLNTVDLITTTFPLLGGDDTLIGGDGGDIGIGGTANDSITGGNGNDTLIGDHGQILLTNGQNRLIETIDPDLGGNDTISGGNDNDLILGGFADDLLFGDNGNDYILGDNGKADYAYAGDEHVAADNNLATLDFVTTTYPLLGGEDEIYGGWGNDTALGGSDADVMYGDNGIDSLSGDWHVVAGHDFNNDGQTDLLWFNEDSGDAQIWLMQGSTPTQAILLPGLAPGWQFGALADLNNDGQQDIVWRNPALGTTRVWWMNGSQSIGSVELPASIGANWSLEGSGDFNNDGLDDLVWREINTGRVSIWLMNGALGQIAETTIATVGAGWAIAGIADFTNDGRPDIVWRNSLTGATHLWQMNGTLLQQSSVLNNVPPQWDITALGDFNHDGKTDFYWRNSTTGTRSIWQMNGTALLNYQLDISSQIGFIPAMSQLHWQLMGKADFNSDGEADWIWHNRSTGELYVWYLNQGNYMGQVQLGTINPDWRIVGVADFGGSSQADILWRNLKTGATDIWLMNQTAIAQSIRIATIATNWNLAGVGDFTNDGQADLAWHDTATGRNRIWRMNQTNLVESLNLRDTSAGWVMTSVGDFDGDGDADLFWRNRNTQATSLWQMNQLVSVQGISLFNVGADWVISTTGDYTNDGKADLIWHQQSTGRNDIWAFNPFGVVQSSSLQNSLQTGLAAEDILLGDHGKVYTALPNRQNFFSIDKGSSDGGGNDTISGNQGDDFVVGQQGDDRLFGNSGDDDMIGGHSIGGADGSDRLDGGSGTDVMLGDNGIITRGKNLDGSLRRKQNGSIQRDVMLLDVGTITGSTEGTPSSNQFASSDLMLLSGAYNANGSKQLNPDQSWKTETQFVTFFADGNDTLAGGDGEDALFGQRGNDAIAAGFGTDYAEGNAGNDQLWGGGGDDMLLGDNGGNLAPFKTETPKVVRGLNIIAQTGGTPIVLGNEGAVVVPNVTIIPQMTAGLLPTLSFAPEFNAGAFLLPPLSRFRSSDGSQRQPLASVIPDLLNHLDLLSGNDTVNGGAGQDLIVGDDYANFMPIRTGNQAVDDQIDQTSRKLHQLIYDLHDLELASSRNTPGTTVGIGNDILNGGDDTDTVLGDDGLFYGPVAQPPSAALSSWLSDLGVVLNRFSGSVNSLLAPFAGGVSSAQPFTLSLNNDVISGDNGDDKLFADDRITIAPKLGSLPYQKGSFFKYAISADEHPGRGNFRDFNLVLGNDQVSGGSGNDLMVGGYTTEIMPIVTAPTGDRVALQQSLDLLANDVKTYVRDLFEDRHGINYQNRDRSHSLNAQNDTMNGDAGNDLMVGDNLTLTLPIINSQLDLSLQLNRGNFDPGDQSHNFFHALPHQYDTLNRNLNTLPMLRDTLTGGDGNDILLGLRAIDQLFGNNGDDFLFGGEENDGLDGGSGSNTVRNTNPSPSDLVNLANPIRDRLTNSVSPAVQRYLLDILAAQNFNFSSQYTANFPG